MSGEKYFLDLTGRPLDGYRTEAVAAALARLLRIPRKNARNLLRGKPSRIKREFDKEKAVHLMGKVIACGAQCEVTPCISQHGEQQTIAASIELSAKLELEIDPPVMALEEITVPTDAPDREEVVPEDKAPLQTGIESAKAISHELPADRKRAHRSGRNGPVAAVKADDSAVSGSLGSGRQRALLVAVGAVVLLGAAVWAGLSFLGGPSLAPQQPVTVQTPVLEAARETDSKAAKTRQRLDLLARSVKIWMIQYGAGFDPSQVTMARMQQDLGIASEEMKDGWGTPFRYVTTEQRYTLISAGPDRTFGTADDLKAEKSSR